MEDFRKLTVEQLLLVGVCKVKWNPIDNFKELSLLGMEAQLRLDDKNIWERLKSLDLEDFFRRTRPRNFVKDSFSLLPALLFLVAHQFSNVFNDKKLSYTRMRSELQWLSERLEIRSNNFRSLLKVYLEWTLRKQIKFSVSTLLLALNFEKLSDEGHDWVWPSFKMKRIRLSVGMVSCK